MTLLIIVVLTGLNCWLYTTHVLTHGKQNWFLMVAPITSAASILFWSDVGLAYGILMWASSTMAYMAVGVLFALYCWSNVMKLVSPDQQFKTELAPGLEWKCSVDSFHAQLPTWFPARVGAWPLLLSYRLIEPVEVWLRKTMFNTLQEYTNHLMNKD